jgi:hypothetical protein
VLYHRPDCESLNICSFLSTPLQLWVSDSVGDYTSTGATACRLASQSADEVNLTAPSVGWFAFRCGDPLGGAPATGSYVTLHLPGHNRTLTFAELVVVAPPAPPMPPAAPYTSRGDSNARLSRRLSTTAFAPGRCCRLSKERRVRGSTVPQGFVVWLCSLLLLHRLRNHR